ncbi:carbohydrate ABC transporter permease [Paenibacillus piri]|uniref:Carbohydrate ABC transporter permease n=2 Tax=Paenibacillus piri TaxID=2547395 RepID=A0A4R5KD03_9BACL|nr:carbohydrate ABC transporter permease [Paenibacillus piri]TDF92027.1 carbohydrate ABC transporter permease [Paenibacillus piri]
MFSLCNNILLALLGIVCVLPLIHVFAVSFSGAHAANANLVSFWPVDFATDAYGVVLGNGNFVGALQTTILRTVLGTVVGMSIMLMIAYSLARENEEFKGRKWYVWFFVFTMLFHGGLVPGYIVVQKLGLINSVWALILPNCVNVFNLILLLNFFRTSVPKALEESAYLDGAGHFKTLVFVYLPISMPAIATISLFTIVYHWNAWFDGLLFMSDVQNYPLSTLLQTIVVQLDLSKLTLDPEEYQRLSDRTLKAAQICITVTPILVVYPFLQRYFVKGIVLGSVKE